LNHFIDLGKKATSSVRQKLIQLFTEGAKEEEHVKKSLIPHSEVTMLLPVKVGNYTDFYSSKNHAFNLGSILRGPDNALQPNWVHLPVGYHGRASSIVQSGQKIIRPSGQINPTNKDPIFSECKKLDIELEMGAIIGKSSEIGKPIKVKDAREYVFGYVVLNDWSARDLQAWEYVPLGPFTAKNFATTISPWIVTTEALEPFKVKLAEQNPKPLKYLFQEDLTSYDISLDVFMKSQNDSNYTCITKSNYKYMYWSVDQQISHHTVSGCNLNVGDILGSGTISGTDSSSYGSLFELSTNGKNAITLNDSESKPKRTFIEDNDSINMVGYCQGDGFIIGFGDCEGTILPAIGEKYFD